MSTADPFDVVTCLFDSIGYAQENDRVVAALRSLGRHARRGRDDRGGVPARAGDRPRRGPEARAVFALADGRDLTRVSETTLDVERMVMRVRYELAVEDEQASETQANRMFSVPEMRLLAEAAGLEVREHVAAYGDGDRSSLDTYHVLLVAGAGR